MSKSSNKQDSPIISRVLGELMESRGLRASELARAVDLPETTIRYLIYGVTKKPTALTLSRLAEYFNVSIEYLISGKEAKTKPEDTPFEFDSLRKVPIISLQDVKLWPFQGKRQPSEEVNEWTPCDETHSPKTFAVIAPQTVRDVFSKNSILIVDPETKYKNGDYIVCSINKKIPTVRRYRKEGEQSYAEDPRIKSPLEPIGPKDVVYGRVVEARARL